MTNILCLLMSTVLASSPSGLELTIYNQGFALVKEVREMNFTRGVQTVSVENVAQLIEPDSVGIRSLSAPGSFTVLEQNYQYDLISVAKILEKAVGGPVTLNRVLPNGRREILKGTLLSSPTAVVATPDGANQVYTGMVLRLEDGTIVLSPTGEVEVTALPEGLISRPTLMWELDAARAGANRVELSYLTQGTTWKADYVLTLDGEGKGDLKGWVTIDNRSGATFRDATLKLLAGDVQRVRTQGIAGRGRRDNMELGARAADFAEEQFADYHLYTLQRPATVRDREMKQLSLLEGFGVPVKKRLLIDAMRGYFNYRPNEGEVGTGAMKPLILIEFTNDKASNLGMPLPRGTIKVFQRDKSGSVQMLGEDSIDHTPRDEKLSLAVGRAFDIVAERKRTRFEWIRRSGSQTAIGTRETFVIELRNRKETPDTVSVFERFWGQHRITANNMPYEKLDSHTVEFVVPLAPNEVKKVEYTVESTWG